MKKKRPRSYWNVLMCVYVSPSCNFAFVCDTNTEARLFVCTGTPVQPHSTVGLSGLDVKFHWIPVPPQIFEAE